MGTPTQFRSDHKPSVSSTRSGEAWWEWLPATFETLLEELDALVEAGRTANHTMIYRGHGDRAWLLDSTFAREARRHLFNVPLSTRLLATDHPPTTYHRRFVTERLLFKFLEAAMPPERLLQLERSGQADAWFEWMRDFQQTPDHDVQHPDFAPGPIYLPGTFLLDWTSSPDVALFFANDNRQGEGALWVVDATNAGNVLMQARVIEILLMAQNKLQRGVGELGVPLIFNPPRKLMHEKAEAQKAIYVAQMELVFDLAEVWVNLTEKGERAPIVTKLVLPAGSVGECRDYLNSRGVTREALLLDRS